MCFLKVYNRKYNKPPKPCVAKKDITVYKMLTHDDFSPYASIIINDATEKWIKGWEYFETTPFLTANMWWNQLFVSGHAFHSKKTKEKAELMRNRNPNRKVVTMIIPKGALYYENNSEYVSSSLIYPE